MKREQAKRFMEQERKLICRDCLLTTFDDFNGVNECKRICVLRDAYDMAIEALSEKHQLSEETSTLEVDTSTNTSTDLISREELRKAFTRTNDLRTLSLGKIGEIIDSVPSVLAERDTCYTCEYWNSETKGCKRNPSVEEWTETDYCSYHSTSGVTSSTLQAPKKYPSADSNYDPNDLISRADVLGYIERVTNSGLGRNKSLDYIGKYVERMPSVSADETSRNFEKLEETEPSDLISRAEALDVIAKAECGLRYADCEADNCSCSYIGGILDLPSVSAERVGKWFQEEHKDYKCSICGTEQWDNTSYCPNCGARMENKK